MNRKSIFLILCIALLASKSIGAQVIRGTVEDTTGLPLNDVRVSLLDAARDTALVEARTGSAGEFYLNVRRAGNFRIRLNRIGYAQQTSDLVELRPAQILTLRFQMVSVNQELRPVVVVERRNVTMDELMSATGFDMRGSKYPMNVLDEERLQSEGTMDLQTLILFHALSGLEIVDDSLGVNLRMSRMERDGRGYCFQEIYLDGTLLSDSEGGYRADIALSILSAMTANSLYGLEVYRGQQIPPPGLGGLFGSAGIGGRPCGVVAVWTKVGRERALIAARAKNEGTIQVLRGTVVDFRTGKPVPGVRLTLKSEFGADLEQPVTADGAGGFSITTKQASSLRLAAQGGGYVGLTTPPFNLDLDEMLTIELILSTSHQPVAPLALIKRELPRMYPATASGGFDYRRRRGIGGSYLDRTALDRSGATALSELLSGLPNVVLEGDPSRRSISFMLPSTGTFATCKPMYFLNGELEREPDSRIAPLPIHAVGAVEVYALASDIPYVYRIGSTGCGMIGVWTADRVK